MDCAEKNRFKSRFFMQKPAMTAWRLRQTCVSAQQSQAGAEMDILRRSEESERRTSESL